MQNDNRRGQGRKGETTLPDRSLAPRVLMDPIKRSSSLSRLPPPANKKVVIRKASANLGEK